MDIQSSNNFKNFYDKGYDPNNQDDTWRMLSAEGKSSNVMDLLKGQNYEKVIEVGAGSGALLYFLNKFPNIKSLYAVEISETAVKKIQNLSLPKVVEASLFDGYKLPYPDNFFDLVICSHVMEHVEFPRLLLREIMRVSKQQFFEVPIDFSLNVHKKVAHFNAYGHINIYSPQTFKFFLLTEGLKVENEKYVFYHDKVQAMANQKLPFYSKLLNSLKKFIVKATPLKYIKPDAFAVLTKK